MSSVYNTPQYRNILDQVSNALDLRRSGIRRKSIGDAISDIIALSVIVQSSKGLDPDGRRWRQLNKKYLLWKLMNGYDLKKNFMTGDMMDFRQVKGMVIVSKDAMSMFYGISPFEQLKAEWTTEGTPHNRRPKRPFYDINSHGDQMIDLYVDQEIDAVIMGLGAKRLP